MLISKERADIVLAFAAGLALGAVCFFLGRATVSQNFAAPAALPCHTAATMSSCVEDVSAAHAKEVGAGPVTVACTAETRGWACYTGFVWNGSRECIVSYLTEGATTGIPVFVKNVQARPAVCASNLPPA